MRKTGTRPSQTLENYAYGGGVLVLFATILAAIAAWITHVIVCIKASAWILLAFGCIVAPVGIIHGIGVWFGVFA